MRETTGIQGLPRIVVVALLTIFTVVPVYVMITSVDEAAAAMCRAPSPGGPAR